MPDSNSPLREVLADHTGKTDRHGHRMTTALVAMELIEALLDAGLLARGPNWPVHGGS